MDTSLPSPTTPFAWLTERFLQFGERVCFANESAQASYAQLHQDIVATAHYLKAAQVPPGAVVTLEADYSPLAIAALIALGAHGCIVAPVADAVEAEAQKKRRVARASYVVAINGDRCDIRHLDCPAGDYPLVRQLAEAQRAGLILFSSGSTGEPKAMIHDFGQLIAGYEKRRTRSLVLLAFLLFDHIGGLNTLFNALASGSCVVAPQSRDPEAVCRLIAAHKVNVLPASPTFLNLLLLSGAQTRHDLSSVKIITYGTEPMTEGLLQRLHTAFPKVKLIQTFGTSETGIAQTSSASSTSTLLKIDNADTEVKIVNGELLLRSPRQVLGYLNHDNSAFDAEGWFHTGDLVEQTPEGYLRILGRSSERINVGGEKVTPNEVESILLEMPQVRDCLVFAEANALTGQSVAAQIVPVDPAIPLRELKRAVRTFCRTRLAPYKIPTRIQIVEATAHSDRFKKIRPHQPR